MEPKELTILKENIADLEDHVEELAHENRTLIQQREKKQEIINCVKKQIVNKIKDIRYFLEDIEHELGDLKGSDL